MSAPVFISPEAADAAVGDVIRVTGGEARHAVTVQRRAVGEVIDVVDGAGARVRGEIVDATGSKVHVRVTHVGRDEDPPVVLVQALAKGRRDEQAVESATELGATRIIPWAAQRSIVQWRGPKALKGRDGWAALAVAAMKQSRRALMPQVDEVVDSRALATLVAEAVASGARVFALHEVAATPLASREVGDGPVWFIVGPEGGIADDELASLVDAGAEPTLLGPHVLRASTAGPAAIAALAVLRGTWTVAPAESDLR